MKFKVDDVLLNPNTDTIIYIKGVVGYVSSILDLLMNNISCKSYKLIDEIGEFDVEISFIDENFVKIGEI
jgi:hypothetical protein